ncbi:MAG: phosphate signaling complex protein PhoU [Acidibacillus sp.]|uniref:Phosphate-specific transport system accessory protein PhoU n=1 Tax=Sulfoacidibacillus ferrooxidans TaxID=2005001 RepID=A0A9X1VA06_9BACL|nr:phosphate signaling complex protein PhoU [Sulfoacidibacillus ferrooxidans]MCI0183470.1 Phosphate-specific transport system accessory protein PhoU [Sulfoacidibacillus ferrooxidans]MCY0891926.1 phosphate signaling complex protein PhoU [Acidibacillus sp.]
MDPRRQFHADLEALQQDLLKMGTLVEESIFHSVRALTEQDQALAEQVLAGDDQIDRMEIDIETRSLQLIALQQPMAGDLRTLGTTLKAVTDLERMADHSVDIAKVVLRMSRQPWVKPLIDIPRMADLVEMMVRDGLTAFIRKDATLAKTLAVRDDVVDGLYAHIFRELLSLMISTPTAVEQAMQLMMVAQNLERIGDHATNIGEWVIYMVDGVRMDLNV